MSKNRASYPAEVFWSERDEGYIAIAPDLYGCSAWGETQAEALKELDDAMEAWKQAATAAGNPIPPPSDKSAPPEYSGKFMVRVPRSLHADLARRAEREGVSLNALAIHLLSANPNSLAGTVTVKAQRSAEGRKILARHTHAFPSQDEVVGLLSLLQAQPVTGIFDFVGTSISHGILPRAYHVMPSAYPCYGAEPISEPDIEDIEIKGMLPVLVAGRVNHG